MSLRITVWNAEWALPGSHKGAAIGEILAALEPDLICLTEAVPALLPPGGHTITSEADYGYPLKPGRRKVFLWSRQPWRDIDSTGHPGLPPGRFISGLTDSPLGPVREVATGSGAASPTPPTSPPKKSGLPLSGHDGASITLSSAPTR